MTQRATCQAALQPKLDAAPAQDQHSYSVSKSVSNVSSNASSSDSEGAMQDDDDGPIEPDQPQEEDDEGDDDEEGEGSAVMKRFARVQKEVSAEGFAPRVMPDLSNVSVGKIVARFRAPLEGVDGEQEGEERYLCVFKGMSLLQARRLTADEIMARGGPQGRRRLLDFLSKNPPLYDGHDSDVISRDVTIVDRVLAVREADDGSGRLEVLVKWRALPYTAATWEFTHDVTDCDQAIRLFHERQRFHARLHQPARPASKQWRQLTESPVFKNDNKLREWQVCERKCAWCRSCTLC